MVLSLQVYPSPVLVAMRDRTKVSLLIRTSPALLVDLKEAMLTPRSYFLGPRFVGVTLRRERGKVVCTAHPSEKSPAALFASQESRIVTLERYQPFQHGMAPPYNDQTAYIDPLRDILFCSPEFFTSAEEVTKIIPNFTRLAVDSFQLVYWSYIHNNSARIGKLKELIVLPSFTKPLGPCIFEDI